LRHRCTLGQLGLGQAQFDTPVVDGLAEVAGEAGVEVLLVPHQATFALL
jgi:hypothetical protein